MTFLSAAASFSHVFGPDLVILFIIFLGMAFPIWMVIDCLKCESSEGNDKIVWLLVIILVPLGSLIYFFFRKLPRPQRASQPPTLPE